MAVAGRTVLFALLCGIALKNEDIFDVEVSILHLLPVLRVHLLEK